MEPSITQKIKRMNLVAPKSQRGELPRPLPPNPNQKLVRVYVEGYEDVAFWRGIFDHFANPYLRFEISVPPREDLPKGKKILLNMIPESSQELILCVDSDFDYIFHDSTSQARDVNGAQFLFHTYTYATENYLCYAPSLHNVCVKATKNDTRIFDFELFMEEYSKAIYPAFLWYCYSAQLSSESIFILADFKNTVRINFLDITNNGANTVAWVKRNVHRKILELSTKHPQMAINIKEFEKIIIHRGVTPETTYLYMHGHTLMDSVVMVALNAVCEKLRQLSTARIINSSKRGTAFKNEINNYTNSLRSIKDVLLDNENYTKCPLFRALHADLARYIITTVKEMKSRGEIPEDSIWDIIKNIENSILR
ncbi:MAG: DUF4435 domain-containing protein [Rikenellaceae bacterium]